MGQHSDLLSDVLTVLLPAVRWNMSVYLQSEGTVWSY